MVTGNGPASGPWDLAGKQAMHDERSATNRPRPEAAGHELAALLQVRLRRVLREGEVLHLAVCAGAVHEREPPPHRAVRAEQEEVLAEAVLLPHPLQRRVRAALVGSLQISVVDTLGLG